MENKQSQVQNYGQQKAMKGKMRICECFKRSTFLYRAEKLQILSEQVLTHVLIK